MKKLIALAGAAALMLASTGVVFGASIFNNQNAFQSTNGAAFSNSGKNFSAGLVSFQGTGDSTSYSYSVSEANHATIKADWTSSIFNNQGAFQSTNGAAFSNTGGNFSGGMFSGQSTGTSYSYSNVGSGANWATITADMCVSCQE